jgi:hypothetical protein
VPERRLPGFDLVSLSENFEPKLKKKRFRGRKIMDDDTHMI